MAKWLRKWRRGWLYVRSNTKNAKSLIINVGQHLTFECLSYFSFPFLHKGVHLDLALKKVLSRKNLGTKLAPYLYTLKATISQQKKKKKKKIKNIYHFKMVANILISISPKWSHDQNFKNHFPKRTFQRNLAQSRKTWIDLHYWNKT